MTNAELIEKAHSLLDCGIQEEAFILWEILERDIEYLEPNEDGDRPELHLLLHHFKEVTDEFYWDWEATINYYDPEEDGSSLAFYPLTHQQVAQLLDEIPNRDDSHYSTMMVDIFLPFIIVADSHLQNHSVPSEAEEPLNLTEYLKLFIQTHQDIFHKSEFWNLGNFSKFYNLST